ncbi:MAG: NAD(P)-dependent oxidoreductase [bacterium]|nr:NAD(P)-dependent oxidoreductase [bacterium]
MKILVTGGSGFIGTNLIEALLNRGYQVMSIDVMEPKIASHKQYFKLVNICDRVHLNSVVGEYKPDHIIHLAARTDLIEKKDILGYAANIDGVKNLIDAIRACGVVKRCIFTSSQLVCKIGYIPKNDLDCKPNTIYGQSKSLTEKIVRENQGGEVEWCIVRPTTIWGPWMSAHYQKLFELIKKGYYFHVGSGNYMKSYGYVGNFCYQLIRLIEAPYEQIKGKTLYLADYEPISLKKWADAFQQELGALPIKSYPIFLAQLAANLGDILEIAGYKKFPFTSFRLRNILTEYVYDLAETQKIIPTLPYSMEEGVKVTVAWIKSYTSSI